MTDLPPKPRLRPSEIASYLDVALSTIYELIRSGELPAKKIGRQYRIPREEFLRWEADRSARAE